MTVPLEFEICLSGTAAAEAQLTKDALYFDRRRAVAQRAAGIAERRAIFDANNNN